MNLGSPSSSDNSNSLNWDEIEEKFYLNGLSLIHINMRSLCNKFAELLAHLSLIKNKFTFIILTETWLHENKDFGFEIPGYKSFQYIVTQEWVVE